MLRIIGFLCIVFFCQWCSAQSILSSTDFGSSWDEVKGYPINMDVNVLDVANGKILLGTERHGLYYDGKDISGVLPGKKINALFVYNQDIYASVYGYGVFKSSNFGWTWSSFAADLEVRAIISVGDSLVFAADNGIHIYDGEEWIQPFNEGQVVSLEWDPMSDLLLAGTWKGVLKSKDRGATWNWVQTQGAIREVRSLKSNIYSVGLNGNLKVSYDEGENWDSLDYKPEQDSYIFDFKQVGMLMYLTTQYGLYTSSDSGKSWKFHEQQGDRFIAKVLQVGSVIYGGLRSRKRSE